MRTGAALAAWLKDDVAQARGLGGSRRFAVDALEAGPLAIFRGALDRLEAAGPSVSMLDVLAALHQLLGEVGWVRDLIAAAAEAALADAFFEPPFASLGVGPQQGLVLVDHPLALVSLAVIPAGAVTARRADGGPRSIGFPGFASLSRVLAGGGAEIALWEADEPGADFASAAAGPCRAAGRRVLADGDLLASDGRTQTFAVEQVAGDLVLLRGEVRVGAAPLAREYDPHTLELVAVSTTNEAASRTALLLSLVRACGRTEAAPLFARIIAEAPFFLRWSAMRELLALEPVAGLQVLRGMARSDPHPEVRAAAEQTEAALERRYPLLFETDRDAA